MLLLLLEMPTVEGLVTSTKVGADFCISFSNPPSALQISCNQFGAIPTPALTWYKDDILAITMDGFGQFSISEEFLNQGNNGLLRFGVLDPPPLVAIGTLPGSGDLILNFMATNFSVADPTNIQSLLPPDVDTNDIVRELFTVLLGSWECRLNNTFGEDSAETELSDCGKHVVAVNIQHIIYSPAMFNRYYNNIVTRKYTYVKNQQSLGGENQA